MSSWEVVIFQMRTASSQPMWPVTRLKGTELRKTKSALFSIQQTGGRVRDQKGKCGDLAVEASDVLLVVEGDDEREAPEIDGGIRDEHGSCSVPAKAQRREPRPQQDPACTPAHGPKGPGCPKWRHGKGHWRRPLSFEVMKHRAQAVSAHSGHCHGSCSKISSAKSFMKRSCRWCRPGVICSICEISIWNGQEE